MSKDIYYRDPALGTAREVDVPGGRLRVFEAGEGPALVFVHGLLVNANLWRKVVARLSDRFHCVCLDLPLGGHEIAMPGADRSPQGLADMVAAAVRELGLEQPTLIGNDSGGAISQIAVTRHPDLAGRLVLTPCDAYEVFPPSFFKPLLLAARFPAATRLGFAPLRMRAPRALPIAFGWLMKGAPDPRVGDSWVLPALTRREITEDVAAFARAADPKDTIEAAEKLRAYDRPVLIAWSREDKFFKASLAERLAADIPNARLEWIEGARTFSPEDQPQRVAEAIAAFVTEAEPSASGAAPSASASTRSPA